MKTIKFSELCGFEPKQWEATATADEKEYTLFGGRRGPGKSYFARWYLLRELLTLVGQGITSPTVGLFCEDYPTLRDRQISKIKVEFPRELGEVKTTQEHGLGFHLAGGAGMIALRNLDDPSKYVGAEFAAIGVDEITKSNKETFDILRGSKRWPGVPHPRFIATGNPGGIGHVWVKGVFIDRNLPPEMQPLADRIGYVSGKPEDNPHLDQSYWEMLATLPEKYQRLWLSGDWDMVEGQYFSEYRREIHVMEPEPIPDNWIRWRAIDWGYAAPFCCLWLARDPDTDETWIYRELYKAGLTDPEQAGMINDLTPHAELERIRYNLADPSMFKKQTTDELITSTDEVYQKLGVTLTKADNARVPGWRRVRDALHVAGSDTPKLRIFKTCENLIRTLPAMIHDEKYPEDLDTEMEDHAVDALRYGLSAKTSSPRPQRLRQKSMWADLRG